MMPKRVAKTACLLFAWPRHNCPLQTKCSLPPKADKAMLSHCYSFTADLVCVLLLLHQAISLLSFVLHTLIFVER